MSKIHWQILDVYASVLNTLQNQILLKGVDSDDFDSKIRVQIKTRIEPDQFENAHKITLEILSMDLFPLFFCFCNFYLVH